MKNPKDRVKLLMVDDEREFLVSTTQALNRRGIQVYMAFDGAMALRMIEDNNFDVLVLDIKMPGMDGVEVFQLIKKNRPGLPVILLTGHGSIPQAFETSKEGVFDYLVKPCDVENLAKVVKDAAAKSEKQGFASRESDDKNHQGVKIHLLIVDDEPELLESLKNVLQRRNMVVTAVQSGEEALKYMRESLVEVVVLDVKMPGMDGIEVLQRIGKDFPNVMVLLLTGHPTVDNAMQGLKKGAFDYIIKPPNIEELTDTIRKAYRSREENITRQQQEIVDEIRSRYPD